MDGEDASSDSGQGPELRPPLTSIDLPILEPGHRTSHWTTALWKRRTSLSKGFLALGAFVFISGASALALWAASGDEVDSVVSEAPENHEGAPTPEEDPTGTSPDSPVLAASDAPPAAGESSGARSETRQAITVPFGNARTFRQALVAAGCSRQEFLALEAALGEVMDFRRCRPEDKLTFRRDSNGVLQGFQYRGSDSTEYFQASRTADDSFSGERVERPIRTETIHRGAEIRTSLAEAIHRAGLERAVVPLITSAFETQANFGTDTRSEDEVRIIVDREFLDDRFLRYGEVHAIRYVGEKTGILEAFWYRENRNDEGEFWDASGHALQGGWLRTPCRFDRISSPFDPNRMHPILRRVQPHNGVDYAAGTGTPVWAAASGRISFAGMKGANGNLVSIRHAGGFESHYAHLSRIARGIRSGTEVEQRQLIGYVGTTGRSTGPHLHFGLKQNGRFVDPMDHLNGPGRMMRSGVLPAYRRNVRRLRRDLDAISVQN